MEKETSNPYLDKIRRMVLSELGKEPVRIYFFGSRACGTASRGSDVDIAVEPKAGFDLSKLALLREKLEESDIPYKVDIVNLDSADARFKGQVHKDGILWKD